MGHTATTTIVRLADLDYRSQIGHFLQKCPQPKIATQDIQTPCFFCQNDIKQGQQYRKGKAWYNVCHEEHIKEAAQPPAPSSENRLSGNGIKEGLPPPIFGRASEITPLPPPPSKIEIATAFPEKDPELKTVDQVRREIYTGSSEEVSNLKKEIEFLRKEMKLREELAFYKGVSQSLLRFMKGEVYDLEDPCSKPYKTDFSPPTD